MNRLHLRRRSAAIGAALGLGATALVFVTGAPSAGAADACRIDRTLDTATFTCPADTWYAAVVQCLGTRQVGTGTQMPTYIIGDSPRPLIPMTLECNGDGRKGIVLNAYLDGPF
ncbi:hypothetical protein ACIP5Y_29770 [Nocardia sp. NPDC088792]|uniref:hypothetical protein n=1 Tax=Nocardia sp. NPDC088792 TaxID=3364332 RepID=UPI00381A656F